MLIKRAMVAVAALLLVSAASASDRATFDAAYGSAESSRKAAAAAKFEWRDTRKMLKRAKKLAEKGDFSKAVALANQAKAQGDAAQAQAVEQDKRWRDFVVK